MCHPNVIFFLSLQIISCLWNVFAWSSPSLSPCLAPTVVVECLTFWRVSPRTRCWGSTWPTVRTPHPHTPPYSVTSATRKSSQKLSRTSPDSISDETPLSTPTAQNSSCERSCRTLATTPWTHHITTGMFNIINSVIATSHRTWLHYQYPYLKVGLISIWYRYSSNAARIVLLQHDEHHLSSQADINTTQFVQEVPHFSQRSHFSLRKPKRKTIVGIMLHPTLRIYLLVILLLAMLYNIFYAFDKWKCWINMRRKWFNITLL